MFVAFGCWVLYLLPPFIVDYIHGCGRYTVFESIPV
jgi:hypothetical protein